MSPLALLLAAASISMASGISLPHWATHTIGQLQPIQDKTVAGVDLDSEADWNAALTKNVSRQNLYNNIIKEVFNSMTRIIGWALIALVLYGNLLSDSKRRKRSLESREERKRRLLRWSTDWRRRR